MATELENPMVVDGLWKRVERTEEEALTNEEEQEDIAVECDVCKESLLLEDLGEEVVKSELWEDTYLCNDDKCLNLHYKK